MSDPADYGFGPGVSFPKFAWWVNHTEPSLAELEVLRCMSRGLTHNMTADTLGRSIETVKTQAMGARFKLRAKNTTEACCEALRRGLIA